MMRASEATVTVSDDADVFLAGRQVKTLLEALEFDESAIEEVVLVVHELASNIVKHAGVGSIDLLPQGDDGGTAIEVRATDSGPGIADIDQAVVDGYSTAGGLGGGLGAVHRLMDEVVINSNADAESGVQIVATRRRQASTSDREPPPLAVEAATRPMPGYDENGDAFLIEHGTGGTLVGVIDGLGHGQAAHRAARRAQQYVQTHSSQSLGDLFAGVERACRDTRGVVMLLARFDWGAREVALGSVGNITVRICRSPDPPHLVPKRGVLGGSAPRPVIAEWDWKPSFVMVVHTDGLSSNWNCDDFSLRDDDSETAVADELLRTLSKQDDDATVLVIRGADR